MRSSAPHTPLAAKTENQRLAARATSCMSLTLSSEHECFCALAPTCSHVIRFAQPSLGSVPKGSSEKTKRKNRCHHQKPGARKPKMKKGSKAPETKIFGDLRTKKKMQNAWTSPYVTQAWGPITTRPALMDASHDHAHHRQHALTTITSRLPHLRLLRPNCNTPPTVPVTSPDCASGDHALHKGAAVTCIHKHHNPSCNSHIFVFGGAPTAHDEVKPRHPVAQGNLIYSFYK